MIGNLGNNLVPIGGREKADESHHVGSHLFGRAETEQSHRISSISISGRIPRVFQHGL